MSAQLITALRRRADKLETEQEPYGYGPECGLNRWLAAEFRKLADEAEEGAP
jgi:hypothetical protein